MKLNGISVVVAESFARMFYRNAINLALPVIECKGAVEFIDQGDILQVDLDSATIKKMSTNKEIKGEKIPPHLVTILENGGLMNMGIYQV